MKLATSFSLVVRFSLQHTHVHFDKLLYKINIYWSSTLVE